MSIFSTRLKEARTAAKLSQEKLGIEAGIDEMSASARMNQYEKDKHSPDFMMVERLAKVLNVPEAYFYTKDNKFAEVLIVLHRMKKSERVKVFDMIIEGHFM